MPSVVDPAADVLRSPLPREERAGIFGSSEGTDVFGKRGDKESAGISKDTESEREREMERKREGGKTPDHSLANLREGVAAHARARTHARSSYISHEVLVGLLGVPLLPLLARLHLG